MGEKGAIVGRKEGERTVEKHIIKPAKVIKAVDSTEAGDAYRAGFLTGYLQGFALQTCGRMGSIAAVYAVEKYGTIEHNYTAEEFRKRYTKNFGQLK